MKTKIFAILTVLLLLGAVASAYPNWDIYDDTDIYDGNYGLINIYDTPPNSTTVNMYGGFADYISAYDESTLNFFGGNADIEAFENSNVSITGGSVGILRSSNNSVISFSGAADSESIRLQHVGVCDINGGTTENIVTTDFSIVNWNGGDITDYISAYDSSIINIYGYDLFINQAGGSYGYGQVYGYLTDDTYISVDLYNSEAYDHINLIPEPATFVLFGIGSLMLFLKNNSKNNTKYS